MCCNVEAYIYGLMYDFIFSQVAHTGFDSEIFNDARIKPYLAFAPACPKGCRSCWYGCKKSIQWMEMITLVISTYIPYCVSSLRYGHAGDLDFAQVTEEDYSNQCIHFYTCNGNGSDAYGQSRISLTMPMEIPSLHKAIMLQDVPKLEAGWFTWDLLPRQYTVWLQSKDYYKDTPSDDVCI